jgi:hypothetical protein
MEILSRSLTVLSWRRSAWATAVLVISRQSAPPGRAKRCVKRGCLASQSRRSTNTRRHRGPWTRTRWNGTEIRSPPAERSRAGRGVCRSARGTEVHIASRSLFFSAPYHQDAGVAVPENAVAPRGGDEAWQREEGTN